MCKSGKCSYEDHKGMCSLDCVENLPCHPEVLKVKKYETGLHLVSVVALFLLGILLGIMTAH